ncbi:MAG: NADP-dependent malic enzyme [Oscillospiraceae bacterium]|nr:NADP-dependent malic enzyme [Oscillospiraceae bacterium]
MDYSEKSLEKHRQWHGKIEMVSRIPLNTAEDLSLAYTPGVAAPCLAIAKNEEKSFELTRRANMVAVVTDGSAVLGLGDIGAAAAIPVMEGKCALFKTFADVDAVPVCINSKDEDDIVKTVRLISSSFGGINLEDISAPRCFEIEKRLKKECNIPVFHDDQHGTAVVTLAALINALKLTDRDIVSAKIVINGAGAAGIAIGELIRSRGCKNIILCDRQGALYRGRRALNEAKKAVSRITNPNDEKGTLEEVIKGADVFIGVSAPGCVTEEMVRSMAAKPILFPLANPDPEIDPKRALAAGAAIVGTGRSDYPNQINNALAFPGIFRGALDVHAKEITNDMKLAAAQAIADFAEREGKLSPEYIIPRVIDKGLAEAVAKAVRMAYREPDEFE